jgi:hypothetical protein
MDGAEFWNDMPQNRERRGLGTLPPNRCRMTQGEKGPEEKDNECLNRKGNTALKTFPIAHSQNVMSW